MMHGQKNIKKHQTLKVQQYQESYEVRIYPTPVSYVWWTVMDNLNGLEEIKWFSTRMERST